MPSRRLFDGAQIELGLLPLVGIIPGIIYNVSTFDGVTTADGLGSTAIFLATTVDGITAIDPFSGRTTTQKVLTDSISGLDSFNRSVLSNLVATDSLISSDSFDSAVDTPGSVSGIVTDLVGVSDTITVQWVSKALVINSVTAVDTGLANGVVSGSVVSTAIAGDTLDGYLASNIVFDVTIFDSVFSTDDLTVEYFSGEDNNLKLTLAPILALYRSAERLNSNFEAVQEAFQNTLSRDGTEPNNMLVDLDMDSNRIINLGAPVDDNDAVRLIDLQNFNGGTNSGGGGTVSLPTNLSFSRNSNSVTVLSDTGTDATLPSADSTNAGVMSAADKAKLDSIEAGATGDMTGPEIVSAINMALGSVTWQGGGGGGGSTNLTFSRTATTVTVLSDTGADAVLPAASSTEAGVMSASDKAKLDGIPSGGGGSTPTNLTFSRDASSVTVISDTGTDAVIPEATNLLAGVFSGTNKAKLDGIDANATKNEVNFVADFAGVGDNATSNNTQFANAEASSHEVIYLPEGNYLTTRAREEFTKKYVGPGKIIMNAYGRKGYQNHAVYHTEVSSSTSSGEYGTNENMRFSDFDFRITNPGTRRNFERYLQSTAAPQGFPKYFWAPATPRFSVYQNKGGWSGTTGITQSNLSPGATSAVLVGNVSDWAAKGLIGTQVGFVKNVVDFGGYYDQIPSDIVTITGATGSTITFTPALTTNYPAGSTVSHGYRTMNTHELKIIDHTGGGDAYAWCGRVTIGYQPLASQTNTFYNATGGIIGGDMNMGAPGNLGTGWECQYIDNGFDGSFINSVNSYFRTNDAAAYKNCVWIHDLCKMEGGGTAYTSYGLKPLDSVYAVGVAAKTGLDFTQSRFSIAAVALPLGERIGFDATMPTTPGPSNGWGFIAETVNSMFIRGNSDGGGKFLAITNGSASILVRPTAIQTNAPIDVQSTYFYGPQYKFSDPSNFSEKGRMLAGTDGTGDYIDWFAGNTYRVRLRATGSLNFNGQFNIAGDVNSGGSVIAGGAFPKFQFATGVYIYWDGSNIRATKNDNASSVVIV